jgi:hypothetical protein
MVFLFGGIFTPDEEESRLGLDLDERTAPDAGKDVIAAADAEGRLGKVEVRADSPERSIEINQLAHDNAVVQRARNRLLDVDQPDFWTGPKKLDEARELLVALVDDNHVLHAFCMARAAVKTCTRTSAVVAAPFLAPVDSFKRSRAAVEH